MVDLNQIRSIERCSMNGLPALETIDIGGWTLRFSHGYTNRGNSVNPLAPPQGNVKNLIHECERLFRLKGLFPLFKLTRASFPDNIEDILTDHGYLPHKPMIRIQAKNLDDTFSGGWKGPTIEESDRVTFPWLMSFARMNHMEPDHVDILSRLLQRIAHPSKFIVIRDRKREDRRMDGNKGTIVACGYGVVENGYLGLFDILVDEDYRRKGDGMQIMSHLMNWGKEQGAVTAYLQVMNDNEPALGMYEKLGFETLYHYWYRIKP